MILGSNRLTKLWESNGSNYISYVKDTSKYVKASRYPLYNICWRIIALFTANDLAARDYCKDTCYYHRTHYQYSFMLCILYSCFGLAIKSRNDILTKWNIQQVLKVHYILGYLASQNIFPARRM